MTTDAAPWEGEGNGLWLPSDDGYVLAVMRNRTLGHMCGYLAVPPKHPWARKEWDSPELRGVFIHNGISCSQSAASTPLKTKAPEGYWVVGFHCADHEKDWIPGLPRRNEAPYRTLSWVLEEVQQLAAAAREAKP